MYLINENCKGGQFANEITKLIGLAIGFISAVLKETDLALLLLNAVKNDLLGIGDCHKPEQLVQRLVVGDLLYIGVFRLVGLVGRLALIQHLKGDHALDIRSGRLRQHPGRIKVLDGTQTRHHGGFQARGSEDDEVVRKSRIVRLVRSEIQIEIDECRH